MNLARKIANEFGRGIAAGFIISFGATVYLMMDNKIVASFLFCFGLFIVSEFDLNLYTGRIGYLATERTGAYLRYVALGLVGNFVGMLISVSILQQTRHANKLIEAASSSAASREGDNLLSLFLLGIYCILQLLVLEGEKQGAALILWVTWVFSSVYLCLFKAVLSIVLRIYTGL